MEVKDFDVCTLYVLSRRDKQLLQRKSATKERERGNISDLLAHIISLQHNSSNSGYHIQR